MCSEEEKLKKAWLLLDKLRSEIDDNYKDFFRSCYLSKDLYYTVKRLKEDLNIAESLAIIKQKKRQKEEKVEHYSNVVWELDYKSYSKTKSPTIRQKLLSNHIVAFFLPDLESIMFIIKFLYKRDELLIFDEDLYFDFKDILEEYNIIKKED